VISPRLVKGGIVQLDVASGRTLAVIPLQYNPDTLTRNLAVQASSNEGGDRSAALRLRGAAVETLKVEAELDATDLLEHPDEHPAAVEFGLHPQIAALELLVQPGSAALAANDARARSGVLEVLPLETPLAVFVWGRNRVVPVRVTELSVTEEAFDARLNPIRARVSLGLRVLSVDDLGFDHRGGALFLGHLRSREAMAARARTTALSALGIEVIG
jgi:hypothetical protein